MAFPQLNNNFMVVAAKAMYMYVNAKLQDLGFHILFWWYFSNQVFDGVFAYSDKTITPKSVNDVKLIHAGKILENNKTLADSRVTMGDLPTGVITMHVVIQPPVAKKKTGLFSFSSFI